MGFRVKISGLGSRDIVFKGLGFCGTEDFGVRVER